MGNSEEQQRLLDREMIKIRHIFDNGIENNNISPCHWINILNIGGKTIAIGLVLVILNTSNGVMTMYNYATYIFQESG